MANPVEEPLSLYEKLVKLGNKSRVLGNHPLTVVIWGLLGAFCVASIMEADILHKAGVFVSMLILYAAAYAFVRETPYMRQRRGRMGDMLCNMLVAFITIVLVPQLNRGHEDHIFKQIRIAIGVLVIVEMAKPVTDYGLVQSFLLMPLGNSINLSRGKGEAGKAFKLSLKKEEGKAIQIRKHMIILYLLSAIATYTTCTIWHFLFLYYLGDQLLNEEISRRKEISEQKEKELKRREEELSHEEDELHRDEELMRRVDGPSVSRGTAKDLAPK